MIPDDYQQQLLKEEINAYAQMLSERGITVDNFEDLPEGLSLPDLRRISERYKQLARTPSS